MLYTMLFCTYPVRITEGFCRRHEHSLLAEFFRPYCYSMDVLSVHNQ